MREGERGRRKEETERKNRVLLWRLKRREEEELRGEREAIVLRNDNERQKGK